MAKTISINAGSSSLKWQLYNMPEEEVIAKGLIERIGLVNGVSTVKFNGQTKSETKDIPDHTAAVKILLDDLISMDIIASSIPIPVAACRVTGRIRTRVNCVFPAVRCLSRELRIRLFPRLCWGNNSPG